MDAVVPEPLGGAHRDIDTMAESLKRTLLESFSQLEPLSIDQLLAARYERIRGFGRFKE